MDIVAQEKKNSKRYLPHTVSTKEGAVKLYRQTKDLSFAGITFQRPLSCGGTGCITARRKLLCPSHTVPTANIPTRTQRKNCTGSGTTIAAIPTSAFASYAANCVRRRPTADTRDHCIVCLSGLDTGRKWSPRRKNPSIWDTMIRRRNWGKSGKWM